MISSRRSHRGVIRTIWRIVFLLIALFMVPYRDVEAQTGTIAGVLVDAQTQRPLAGAQVVVSGTSNGTITDPQGRFRLTGLPGEQVTIEVVMLGHRRLQQTVSVGSIDVRLSMSEAAINLDEIVVTGTPGGTQRRALGNSVGSVRASEVTAIAPVGSVQQLLGGRIPGVSLTQASGNLGSGASTRIRGVSTMSLTSEPIVYVDGVRINSSTSAGPNIRNGRQVSRLNDIPPEEIDRIEVIRGPAAATLYGTEASNGVIQIFTKRGVSGQRTFDATLRYGANWLPNPAAKYPEVWWKDPATNQLVSVNLVEQEEAAGRPIFSDGPVSSLALSAGGGTDGIRYFLAGETGREEGVVPYNWQRRTNARANLEVTLGEKFDVGANLGVIRNRTRLAQSLNGWDLQAQLVWGTPRQVNQPVRGFLRAPPDVLGDIDARSEVDRSTFSITANHRPLSWLTQRLTVGTDIGNERNSILVPRNPAGDAFFFGALSLGDKQQESQRSSVMTADYALTASAAPAEDLSLTTSFGLQHFARAVETVTATGRVFPASGIETVGGAATTLGNETFLENKTLGLYVQEQIGWKDRAFLTAAVRMDDNSAFGENFNAAIYPKVSGTWVLSEEPFWSLDWLNLMRLRAAWGRAGQQPDIFASVRLFQPTTGPNDAATVTPQNVGNPDLKPEIGEEIEAGFDASLLDERLAIGFTYYRKRTRDAIVQRPALPSDGFPGNEFVNLGELLNSGVELQATITPLRRAGLSADISATLSTNENEVLSLGGLPAITFGRQRHQEGFPIGAFFHRVVVSSTIGSNGTATNVMCRGGEDPSVAPVPCANAPRVFTGRSTPAWFGSLSSNVTIRNNVRLYALVDFRGGYFIENGDIGAGHVLILNSRAVNEATDPVLMGHVPLGEWQRAGFMDAGFAKLREVSATYTLPQVVINRTGATRASLTLAARNLATLWQATHEVFGTKVVDPEMGDSGFYQTVLPQTSQVVATLRVSF